MKQGISWLLLIAFCLPAIGTWGLFTYQQRCIRKEIKQKIKAGVPIEQQTQLKFSAAEMESALFFWVNDHEFKYKGTAYDILSQVTQNDTTYFSCIRDEDETRLFKALDEQVSLILNQEGTSKERKQNVIRFYKNLFWTGETQHSIALSLSGNSIGTCNSTFLSNPKFAPEAPPPEHFS